MLRPNVGLPNIGVLQLAKFTGWVRLWVRDSLNQGEPNLQILPTVVHVILCLFRVVKKFEQLEQVFKSDITTKVNAATEKKTDTRPTQNEPTRYHITTLILDFLSPI